MKKALLMIAGFLSIGAISQAQIKNDRGTFTKPAAGDMVFETQMSPNVIGGSFISLNDAFMQGLIGGLNSSDVFGSSNDTSGSGGSFRGPAPTLPLIRARKFTSETEATRYLFNLSYSRYGTKMDKDKMSQSQFGITLGYGKEKHKAGAERLCTYMGWDVLIGFARIGQTVKPDGGTDTKSHQSGFGVGVRGFTGFDYYIVPKVYLGVELGMGLGLNSYGKTKIGDNDDKTTSTNFLLSPYILPSFRLGWRM